MELDVIYKIRVFVEKNKGKGDLINFVKCRILKVGEYLEYLINLENEYIYIEKIFRNIYILNVE